MTQAISRDAIYRRRRFQSETIELCVRWYITYRLSYRDLVGMTAERGIIVSHTTIMRWVMRYVPEFEKRWARYARSVHSSWRVDETAVSVRGGPHYLYRAVDKHGKSVGSLLRADRGIDAAQAFFRSAVATQQSRWPRKVTLDGNAASHRALRLLCQEDKKVAVCRSTQLPLSEQHRRARSSGDQTPMRIHAGLQVIQDRCHHARRHRARTPNTQAAVLVGPRPTAPAYVAETTLGSGVGTVSAVGFAAVPIFSGATASAPELAGPKDDHDRAS